MYLDCEFVPEAVVSPGDEAPRGGRGMERAYSCSQETTGPLIDSSLKFETLLCVLIGQTYYDTASFMHCILKKL